MANFSRIPAIVPIEFMKVDGLPFEAYAVIRTDGVDAAMDLSTYTAKFVVLTKNGATVYESTDVDMDDEGHILHPIAPETVADWTLCPERYYLQVFPPIGNPLTLFKGSFSALDV